MSTARQGAVELKALAVQNQISSTHEAKAEVECQLGAADKLENLTSVLQKWLPN